jgi:hypothetical protein
MNKSNAIQLFAKGQATDTTRQVRKNAVIYTRVSTKKQADTNQSQFLYLCETLAESGKSKSDDLKKNLGHLEAKLEKLEERLRSERLTVRYLKE